MLNRILLVILLFISARASAIPPLEPVRNLAADAAQAACSGQPLVLMFSADYCRYCHIVRDLYLRPLQQDKRYPGIVVRELTTNSSQPVKGFDGKMVTMKELASRYETSLVPVVALFGPSGELLAKPIVGLSSQDFYGYYLDEALQSAGEKVSLLSGVPNGALREYACD